MRYIYVDSSYDQKRGIAGIGIIIEENGVTKKPISMWIKAPDNNWGELWGIYQAAILSGGAETVVISDSQVALDYVAGNREFRSKPDWTQEKFIKHNQMRVLAHNARSVSRNVRFEWIKAHTNKLQVKPMMNKLADMYANLGRSKYYELGR